MQRDMFGENGRIDPHFLYIFPGLALNELVQDLLIILFSTKNLFTVVTFSKF